MAPAVIVNNERRAPDEARLVMDIRFGLGYRAKNSSGLANDLRRSVFVQVAAAIFSATSAIRRARFLAVAMPHSVDYIVLCVKRKRPIALALFRQNILKLSKIVISTGGNFKIIRYFK